MNQIPTSEDGCKALSCSSVQSCLLVARALLRSEPFSAWSLRITFFEEYCWAAWLRLEEDLSKELARNTAAEIYAKVGLKSKKSRLDRPLPPKHLSPAPICDFSGVDGARKSLMMLTEEEKSGLKLDAKVSKPVQQGRSPGQWPEKLPKTLTVRAMGGTWDILKKAPLAPMPIIADANLSSNVDKTVPQMKLNDEDLAELSWQRYLQMLKEKQVSLDTLKPSSSALKSQACFLCHSSVTLQQHLTYSTCPSPHHRLRPSARHSETPTLSQFGFHRNSHTVEKETSTTEDAHCHEVFHVECLAQHFTSTRSTTATLFVLPTHGFCPSCGTQGEDRDMNTWIEVMRSVYRRKERLELEWAKAEACRLREEKLALKNATKKTSTARSSSKVQQQQQQLQSSQGQENVQKREGLLGALDDIQTKPTGKRSYQPVSSLLKDPIHPRSKPSAKVAAVRSSSPSTRPLSPSSSLNVAASKRSPLLCNLDNLLNIASGPPSSSPSEAKRSKATTREMLLRPGEVIDLT
jgi:hypothetical protein